MIVIVSVVGRRNGGGFKVTELGVRTSSDPALREADVNEAVQRWCKLHALELKLFEVLT